MEQSQKIIGRRKNNMEERKCPECGEVILENLHECPRCGCPLEDNIPTTVPQETQPKISKEKEVHSKKKVNIMPLISLVIGIIVFILGCTLLNHKYSLETYSARSYNVDSAAFGADFYTEIYGASDTIVDELSDINGGIATISGAFTEIVYAIYFSGGIIVIALGLGIVAMSLLHIGKAK